MLRATRVLPAGTWSGETSDSVCLDFDQRHRRRLRMLSESGMAFLLDLARTTVIADGDALELEDGRRIAVQAREEALVRVTAADPRALTRLAWHLGNRHLATEIGPDYLLIRDDRVIVDMLEGLGAGIERLSAPFHPESGAYAHAHD